MKRYLVAMVTLTLLVVSPFVYQRWAEAKRLDSLAELRAAARELILFPVEGAHADALFKRVEDPIWPSHDVETV